MVFVSVIIRGRVQGVGYRYWLRQEAKRRNVNGWVRNLRDGTVEAYFAGDSRRVADILAVCRRGPAEAQIDGIDVSETADEGGSGFRVRRDAN
ncbi:MAG: acylphosphatase [Alphaproteobacteria bacterium]